MEQVFIEKVKKIIINCEIDIKVTEIIESTKLQEDLGFNSIKMIQVICEIENELNIEIDVGDEQIPLHQIQTFGELIKLIEKYM